MINVYNVLGFQIKFGMTVFWFAYSFRSLQLRFFAGVILNLFQNLLGFEVEDPEINSG